MQVDGPFVTGPYVRFWNPVFECPVFRIPTVVLKTGLDQSCLLLQVALESGGSGGVVWRIRANATKLVCAVGSRNGTEETKLLVLDFDVQDSK